MNRMHSLLHISTRRVTTSSALLSQSQAVSQFDHEQLAEAAGNGRHCWKQF